MCAVAGAAVVAGCSVTVSVTASTGAAVVCSAADMVVISVCVKYGTGEVN